jgi:DNA topoisomerase-2
MACRAHRCARVTPTRRIVAPGGLFRAPGLTLRRSASSKAPAARDDRKFERLTPIEHVLRRPGMYIGSTSVQQEPIWVFDPVLKEMVWRQAHYIPGLYKIFDEILVNALDNAQRDPKGTDQIAVSIERRSGRTSVMNTGRGIPVRPHESEPVYIPEMVMGSLFTGSNFDDSARRTVGGRHGFGAKLTNLFSSEFEVETADTAAGLRFHQRWSANMSERSEPTIEPLAPGEGDFTRVTFTPDLARFGEKHLHADMLAIFQRRVYEAAAAAPGAVVTLNGKPLRVRGLPGLAKM